MQVVISNSSDKPIYEQLFDQIGAQILKGELKPEEGLPAIRTAAKELRVSVITVKKAWEELERLGFIYSVVGRGCFVADLSGADLKDKQKKLLEKKIAKDVEYYKGLGLTLKEIIEAIKQQYNK